MVPRACRAVLLSLVLAFCAGEARALDAVSLELGGGDDRTRLWRVGLQWDWNKRWLERGRWHLGARWEVQLGHWTNGEETGDLSLTPVFRYQRSGAGWNPYFEAAIGFHLLSDLLVSRRRSFSTNFQFGDHLGAGARNGRHELGLRLQHISNGGIARPNPGINFLILRYQRYLD